MQRVVAGSLRGRRLLPLPRSVSGVRPSSSRVRSAIFDRLQLELRDARVLDLFAGSGALAIEALSRGAASAVLVERQAKLARFLPEQISTLGLHERATVVHTDALRYLSGPSPRSQGPFDIVLVDPPYAELALYSAVLSALAEGGVLREDAVVVIEYQVRRGRHPDIARLPGLSSEAVRTHGQTALEFFRHTGKATSS